MVSGVDPGSRVLWAKNRPGHAREVRDYPSVVLLIFRGHLGGQSGEIARTGHFRAKLKWRSFTKVTIPIPVHRNSSYDKFIARVMQSGDLDCAPSDVVISYVMHSREKVNPMIINSDVRVLTYIMDTDADGFRTILRINVVERSFEGPLNSSAPLLRRPAVDDDLIDHNLSDYENNVDDTINMEDYSMHMEEFSSDSQDNEEDHETES
ncbi:hypothetical protein BC332_06447 [Capsicum chinense]|nr:hypothetical protein BC332_06447 [Capsicum chinense]